MLLKTRGIVLHQIKYSESSLIVTVYTEEFGRKSFMVNNVRGKRASQKPNVFQPLFLLEMDVYYKLSRDLQRIKEFKNIAPFTTIPYQVIKSTLVLFLAEILYRAIREEEPNRELFEFLFNSIRILDLASDGIRNFHILFLLQLTKYLGFYPENNFSIAKSYFDLQNGIFINSPPFHPHYLDQNLSRILHRALQINFTLLDSLTVGSEDRFRLLEKILTYYALHIDSLGVIKSVQVLREVFH